jgi:hypothetical protein
MSNTHKHSAHSASELNGEMIPILRRLRSYCLPFALIGLVLLGVGLGMAINAGKLRYFWSSYMYGFLFWLGITLGATTLTFLHHTIRAQWSNVIARFLEAGNKNLWIMAVAFIPILVDVLITKQNDPSATTHVFPWANPEAYHLTLPASKQQWFSTGGFVFRAIGYFAFWILTTRKLNASSALEDATLDPALGKARQSFAPPMGVIHVILLTFAITDWMMSLDPTWMSTIYGVVYMIWGMLANISLGTFILLSFRDKKPFKSVMPQTSTRESYPGITKDLGNMQLGLTMFWTYTTLSQFLIIWSGNLPEEINFYKQRFEGPHLWLGTAIILCGFLLTFVSLLSGNAKRDPVRLRLIAGWILVWRLIDMWWQVVPFFRSGLNPANAIYILSDIGAILLFGGVWGYYFFQNLSKQPLLPLYDTRTIEDKEEATAHA